MWYRIIASLLFLAPLVANSQTNCDRVLEYAYDQKYSTATNFQKFWLLRSLVTDDSREFGGSFLAKIPVPDLPIPIDGSGSAYAQVKDSAARSLENLNITFSESNNKQLLVNSRVIDAWSSCIGVARSGLTATLDENTVKIEWITPQRTTDYSARVTSISTQGDIQVVKTFTGILNNATPQHLLIERTTDEEGNVNVKGGTIIIQTKDRGSVSLRVLPLMPSICTLTPSVCWATPYPADTVAVHGDVLLKDHRAPSKDAILRKAEELEADHILYTNWDGQDKQATFFKNGSIRKPCSGCSEGITYAIRRVLK